MKFYSFLLGQRDLVQPNSSITAKTSDLDHSFLNQNKALGGLVQNPQMDAWTEKEFQFRLGHYPQGIGLWLEREIGLSIRVYENEHAIVQIRIQMEDLKIT